MTNEYIVRIVKILHKYQINYLITGGAARFIREEINSTMDLDILLEPTETNYLKADQLGTHFGFKNKVSEILKENKIARLHIFPFRVDILPFLDGLNTQEVFQETECAQLNNVEIKLISKKNLNTNYGAVKQLTHA